MEKLLKLLFGIGEMDMKADIKFHLDSKKEECITEIEGNLPSVLTALSFITNKLIENGIPEELIKGAIDVGIDTKSKSEKVKTKVIKVDNKEKAEKLEKLLKELVEDK